jgi:hypothetical protein
MIHSLKNNYYVFIKEDGNLVGRMGTELYRSKSIFLTNTDNWPLKLSAPIRFPSKVLYNKLKKYEKNSLL